MNTIAKSDHASDLVYCVDLAKNKFQVHTFAAHGERLQRRTLNRTQFDTLFCKAHTPRGLIVMEACGSAHHWARRFGERGYRVKLIPAQFVAKRRMGNKNDGNDADAIYAVHTDPRVRCVPVKTLDQQDLCAWHCVRERLVGQRTQCINQIRGLLAERGWVQAKGKAGLDALLRQVNAATDTAVTPALQHLVAIIAEQIDELSAHLAIVERQLKAALATSPVAQNLQTIFGVGVVTATAFASETGANVQRFADARQFAAGIGITPREASSGQTRRLGHITKRGNPYLRRLLVQCAQVIVNLRNQRDDRLCVLARRLFAKHNRRNTVIVAIANHLARIIYAVIKHGKPYQPGGHHAPAAA
ncbi:MAG TPA: IS110 family transposase [Mariprofundaceae bacterium]|nr:IS110 family transposase [Mariprofundaceae bacterium]